MTDPGSGDDAAPRITVVVLSFARDPWLAIERYGQRRTWCADTGYPLPTRFVYGVDRGVRFQLVRTARGGARRLLPRIPGCRNISKRLLRHLGRSAAGRQVRQSADRLFADVPEGYFSANPKTIAAFRYLLAHDDFEYLFRTNTSTYVHRARLMKFLSAAPRAGYYAGVVEERDGIAFASGTGVALSRDLVELVVNDQDWEYELIDDVAIGRSLHRFGVHLQPLPRVDAQTGDRLRSISPAELSNVFFVRCKGLYGRDHDIRAMTEIHERYAELDRRKEPGTWAS